MIQYTVRMIKFEWNLAKATANIKKHGVSFEEAQSVFYDEFAIQFLDEEHSTSEERFLLLGMSAGARLLLVCHCEREAGDTIRIISARKATKTESTFYGAEKP
jgi:uncharacterized DUF497 family protein